MAVWDKVCNSFKDVRCMIAMEEETTRQCMKIMYALEKCCDELTSDDEMSWDFYDDFRDLKWEIHEAVEFMDGEDYESCVETVDNYLTEMYGLCDVARVWLAV